MSAPKPESWRTRLLRWRFNWFPAFRRTGGRIRHIASDFTYVRVQLPLNWRTRNYVGTLFGGSIYGAVDPVYMVMFIKLLGPEYVVWDKSATVEFRKPGKSTLTAEFAVTNEDVETIRTALATAPKFEWLYRIELKDEEGELCAVVDQTLHFALKT
jgi:acyl-coenzyme A thioesterase PaaI-like protein